MAFYYVKSGGTAAASDAGRYVSEKANNSWATEFTAVSEYYDSIEIAMEVGDVGGTRITPSDVIHISSASTFNKAGTVNITLGGTVPDSPILVYSVDDLAVQEYLAGATEEASSNGDYVLSTNLLSMVYHGAFVKSGDDFGIATDGSWELVDGGIELNASGDIIKINKSGKLTLNNVAIVYTNGTTSAAMLLDACCQVEMIGGSTVATSGTLNDFVALGAVAGGFIAKFIGVDLSNHGTGTYLLGQGGGVKTDDMMQMIVDKCPISANLAGFVEEEFTHPSHYFLATNSSAVSAAAEYQFFQRTWAGDVEDQDSAGIVRTESTAFVNGEQVSIKVTTNSSCGPGRPLIFDLPARFAALSNASTDTLRLFFAQPNTQPNLTDANCYAKLIYPDGTVKNQFNTATNQATLLTAGIEHTDDSASSTWEDNGVALVNHDEYRMDVDTSVDAGDDAVPIIRIFVEEPSVTISFDTTVDVVA